MVGFHPIINFLPEVRVEGAGMRLSEAGERRVIHEVLEVLAGSAAELAGSDDCAVLQAGGLELLVSCDAVIEAVHIPEEMKPEQVGWYAVSACLSDIAAMGGRALGVCVSMGFPESAELELVRGIAEGLRRGLQHYGVRMLGGDTQRTPVLMLSCFALGVAGERLVKRSGASPGEVICVTGTLGEAPAGFLCLTGGVEHPECGRLIRRAFEPVARLEEGRAIAGHAGACMDLSDSLSICLHEIAEQSGTGFEVHYERLPAGRGVEEVAELAGAEPEELLLYMGGDFELVFTVEESRLPALREELERLGCRITPIGRVLEEGRWLVKAGRREVLERRGYDAFRGYAR